MCARRFLLLIFWLTLIVVAGAFAIYEFGGRALSSMATPRGHFQAPLAQTGPDYALTENWIARPDLPAPQNPALWRPEGSPPPILALPAAPTISASPSSAPPSSGC